MEPTKTVKQWIVSPDGKITVITTSTTTVDSSRTAHQTSKIEITSNSQGSSIRGSISASIP